MQNVIRENKDKEKKEELSVLDACKVAESERKVKIEAKVLQEEIIQW